MKAEGGIQMLTHEEILQARERYLFSERELYVLPDAEGPAYSHIL